MAIWLVLFPQCSCAAVACQTQTNVTDQQTLSLNVTTRASIECLHGVCVSNIRLVIIILYLIWTWRRLVTEDTPFSSSIHAGYAVCWKRDLRPLTTVVVTEFRRFVSCFLHGFECCDDMDPGREYGSVTWTESEQKWPHTQTHSHMTMVNVYSFLLSGLICIIVIHSEDILLCLFYIRPWVEKHGTFYCVERHLSRKSCKWSNEWWLNSI